MGKKQGGDTARAADPGCPRCVTAHHVTPCSAVKTVLEDEGRIMASKVAAIWGLLFFFFFPLLFLHLLYCSQGFFAYALIPLVVVVVKDGSEQVAVWMPGCWTGSTYSKHTVLL